MKINLYLDDLRKCPDGFVVARTFEEAINIINSNEIGILTLDHDLGSDEKGNILKNGYDFVKYFCEKGLYADEIYMHTDNPVGRNNMYQTLLSAQRHGLISDQIKIRHYPITKNLYT